MARRRERWRKRMLGLISVTKRLALVAARIWSTPTNRRKRESLNHHHDWEGLAPQLSLNESATSPTRRYSLIALSTPAAYLEDTVYESLRETTTSGSSHSMKANRDTIQDYSASEHINNSKRYTLREIPFSFIIPCAASELPEDVERLIFEMAAKESRAEALHTLVFVNHRIQKWVEYIIYESVILRDAKHARLFLDGLEQKHPDFAAGAIQILALPTRVSFDTSFNILKLCKGIQHLSWLPTNPLPTEILDLVADLPLTSLRARLVSFTGSTPDFSVPLFKGLTTLFVADHQDVWTTWRWDGLRKQPKLKWLAFNLDGRLETSLTWAPVRVLENAVLKPHGGANGIRLCICYSYSPLGLGDRWFHRSEDTFSHERMAVLCLDRRMDERGWEMRINGDRRDFEISEELVQERQTKERRLRFNSPTFASADSIFDAVVLCITSVSYIDAILTTILNSGDDSTD